MVNLEFFSFICLEKIFLLISSCIYLFCLILITLLSLSISILASHPALGMQIHRKRNQSCQTHDEKVIIT